LFHEEARSISPNLVEETIKLGVDVFKIVADFIQGE